jgi:hypothetical protein
VPPGSIPDSFVALLTEALRRHGEAGAITRGAAPDTLELAGPPARQRLLRPIYGRWLRAPAAAREAIVDEFGRFRFGSHVVTDDANAVTDVDINHDAIHCCGNEDLVIVRCPACRQLWIYCAADDVCHVDLQTTARKLDATRGDKCPSCGTATHLHEAIAPLLPTRDEVVAAGLERYLKLS